jgi:hypothetical protein
LLVAEVASLGWIAGGELPHASFRGLVTLDPSSESSAPDLAEMVARSMGTEYPLHPVTLGSKNDR